jgi:hypothetical protein
VLDEAAEILRRRMGLTAQGFARSALRCWKADDLSGFYLNAGTALELAIKARLCTYGIAFLGPNRTDWFKHVLRLARDADVIGDGSPFSVSGPEALDRLLELEPALAPEFGPAVRDTINRCNMVKHVGTTANPTEAERIEQAGAFVTAIDHLVQIKPADFWSEHLALAESLVQDARDVTRVRVAAAEAKARERLAAVGERLTELAEKATAEIAQDEDGDHGYFAVIKCPICGSPARAYGDLIDNGDVEVDWNPDGTDYFWAHRPMNIVERFVCGVCEFELNGADQIRESQIPAMADNERVDSELLAEADFDPY